MERVSFSVSFSLDLTLLPLVTVVEEPVTRKCVRLDDWRPILKNFPTPDYHSTERVPLLHFQQHHGQDNHAKE